MLLTAHDRRQRHRDRLAAMQRVDVAVAKMRAEGASEEEILEKRAKATQAVWDAQKGEPGNKEFLRVGRAVREGLLVESVRNAMAFDIDLTSRSDRIIEKAKDLVSARSLDHFTGIINRTIQALTTETKTKENFAPQINEFEHAFEEAKIMLFKIMVSNGDPLEEKRKSYIKIVEEFLDAAKQKMRDYDNLYLIASYIQSKDTYNLITTILDLPAEKTGFLQRNQLKRIGDTRMQRINQQFQTPMNAISTETQEYEETKKLLEEVRNTMAQYEQEWENYKITKVEIPRYIAKPTTTFTHNYYYWPIYYILGIKGYDNSSPIKTDLRKDQIEKLTGFHSTQPVTRDPLFLQSLICALAYIRPDIFFKNLNDINAKNQTNLTQRQILARIFGTTDPKENPDDFIKGDLGKTKHLKNGMKTGEAAFVLIFVAMMGYKFQNQTDWVSFRASLPDEDASEDDLRRFFFENLVFEDDLYTKATWIYTKIKNLQNLRNALKEKPTVMDALNEIHGNKLSVWNANWNEVTA